MKSAELRRLFELSKQELLLKVVESKELLENRNNAPKVSTWEQMPINEHPSSIEIEEDANEQHRIKVIPERTWVESVSRLTGLDVRAIVSDLPVELGLYHFDCVAMGKKTIGRVVVKVWVVPTK